MSGAGGDRKRHACAHQQRDGYSSEEVSVQWSCSLRVQGYTAGAKPRCIASRFATGPIWTVEERFSSGLAQDALFRVNLTVLWSCMCRQVSWLVIVDAVREMSMGVGVGKEAACSR